MKNKKRKIKQNTPIRPIDAVPSPRLQRNRLPHCGGELPVARELRPQLREPLVVAQQAAVRQEVHGGGAHGLAGAEYAEEGRGSNRAGVHRPLRPGAEVDESLAPVDHAHLFVDGKERARGKEKERDTERRRQGQMDAELGRDKREKTDMQTEIHKRNREIFREG